VNDIPLLESRLRATPFDLGLRAGLADAYMAEFEYTRDEAEAAVLDVWYPAARMVEQKQAGQLLTMISAHRLPLIKIMCAVVGRPFAPDGAFLVEQGWSRPRIIPARPELVGRDVSITVAVGAAWLLREDRLISIPVKPPATDPKKKNRRWGMS